MGDIFVNDAFGTIHRRHASNYGISCYMRSVTGFLVQKELDNLNRLTSPEKPFVVIMGGAKVSDKTKVIDSLIKKADYILIGGAMAFTFLKAEDYEIGKSFLEKGSLDLCQDLLKKYKDKIILPDDFYGELNDERVLQKVGNIDKNFKGLDIGQATVKKYKEILKKAKTVFWNGPLGMYEEEEYIYGTKQILRFIKKEVKMVILGGGDVVSASNLLNYTKDIEFASTGGGATLKYIENHKQPGLENMRK
jgi:phosphoglycerate kinase